MRTTRSWSRPGSCSPPASDLMPPDLAPEALGNTRARRRRIRHPVGLGGRFATSVTVSDDAPAFVVVMRRKAHSDFEYPKAAHAHVALEDESLCVIRSE